MKLSILLLFPIIGLTIGGISFPVAADITCPKGSYENVSLRYVGWRNTISGSGTKMYFPTFSPTHDVGLLRNNIEYRLSSYTTTSGAVWLRPNYATALTALATGSKVGIHCDGTAVDEIYIYQK